MKFQSTNNLDFYHGPWDNPFNDEGWTLYRIGTVSGQWRCLQDAYEILSFLNDQPGNGHLQDVFDWFENSCKRDNRDLRILEVGNEPFKKHLIEKRGFEAIPGTNHLIKKIRK